MREREGCFKSGGRRQGGGRGGGRGVGKGWDGELGEGMGWRGLEDSYNIKINDVEVGNLRIHGIR